MKTAKEISILLSQRAEEIVQMLLPQGKKDGKYWQVGSVSGETGKSLKVVLTGAKAGVWADFAAGVGGDLLDLWAVLNRVSLSEALKQSAAYLGIKFPTFEEREYKTYTRPKQKIEEAPQTVIEYLTKVRCLSTKTIGDFNIGADKNDIVFPYIRDNEIVFIKYLSLTREGGKKIIRVEKDCEPCLFGWHLISPNERYVTICEGEIDAMTLHQYGFHALSVPFGGGGGNKQAWIEHELERLAICDDIYLCFDNDESGKQAAEEIAKRLGQYRCKLVKLPRKDANECLQAGITKELMQQCFDEARNLDPDELKIATSFCAKVIEAFYPPGGIEPGYQMPWDKCNDKILFRPNELTVWTGINGHGKSQFLGHALLHMMNSGAKVCMASLELKAAKLLQRMTRQATALNLPSIEYIEAVHKWYFDKLWLFDLVGQAKSDRLLEVFTYAYQKYGIDVFVIDSFMKLDIADDDYKAQKSFMDKLCDFKNQFPCHVHLVVHPRKGADESTAPGKLDSKGTGAITDLADNCLSIWRNKPKEKAIVTQQNGFLLTDKELELLKMPDCVLRCDKQRNGDWEGSFGFWFDLQSYQYLQSEASKAVRIVEYSSLQVNTL